MTAPLWPSSGVLVDLRQLPHAGDLGVGKLLQHRGHGRMALHVLDLGSGGGIDSFLAARRLIEAGCRDVKPLTDLKFPVWSRAVSAQGTVKESLGDVNLPLGGENAADGDVHDRDLDWLRSADVLVAEVTTPSLGVGYEIGRAVEWGKRVVCLYRPTDGKRLSGMIAGCRGVTVHEYVQVTDVDGILRKELTPDPGSPIPDPG